MESVEKPVDWFSVTVVAERNAEPAIESAFGILDADGTEIDSLRKQNEKTISFVAYFKSLPKNKSIERALSSSMQNHGLPGDLICEVIVAPVPNEDWLAEWKKHWKQTESGRFVISPPWDQTGFENKIRITIEPAMAFGTGTHETTRLCLEIISEYYQPGMSFLDVGTGTGILSIAAAKLTDGDECEMQALDIDSHSVEVAAENAALNGINGIAFETGSVSSDTHAFDFVCANMTIDIIGPMLPLLAQKSKRYLVLSGILAEQEALLNSELKPLGLVEKEVTRDGEWIAVTISI